MKYIRVIICILLCSCISITIFVGKGKIQEEKILKDKPNYKGILTLWHVDTFEGGIGSRKQFLNEVITKFERKNQGVLITCIEHTLESLRIALEKGNTPDIISYGLGVEGLTNLVELDGEYAFCGSTINGKTYAYPWCKGGYVLVYNPKLELNVPKNLPNEIDQLVVSQNTFTQPILALLEQEINVKKVIQKTPMDAYLSFVSGETKVMLGTQRDVNRLISRQMDFEVLPLTNYNDLYQYISIMTQDKSKQFYAQEFLKLLLSKPIQENLTKIGMASNFYNLNYQNEQLNKMQLSTKNSTLSILETKATLLEYQDLSLKGISGDNNAKVKLKKVLIHP